MTPHWAGRMFCRLSTTFLSWECLSRYSAFSSQPEVLFERVFSHLPLLFPSHASSLLPPFGWIPLCWWFSQMSIWTFLSTSLLPVTSQTIHLLKNMQLKLCTHLGLSEHYIPVCRQILRNLLDWTGELIMGCDV